MPPELHCIRFSSADVDFRNRILRVEVWAWLYGMTYNFGLHSFIGELLGTHASSHDW